MVRSRIVAIALSIPLLAVFEGIYLVDYYDPIGVPTACFGHTEGAEVGRVRTVDECEDMLFDELRIYQKAVLNNVTVELNDNQLAALSSFVYNVGETNFKSSTLLRKLNAGDYIGACQELPRWVYASGVKLRGLERRRAAEMELCLT